MRWKCFNFLKILTSQSDRVCPIWSDIHCFNAHLNFINVEPNPTYFLEKKFLNCKISSPTNSQTIKYFTQTFLRTAQIVFDLTVYDYSIFNFWSIFKSIKNFYKQYMLSHPQQWWELVLVLLLLRVRIRSTTTFLALKLRTHIHP